MKIVHTSDWHVGCRLYDNDRSADHRHMASKIIEICRDRRPDALLIAGDLFDNDRPSAADERLVADTLARLHAEVPEMTVIAIAGNHDSPSRHESHEAVYAAAGVVMIGRITDRDPDWPGRYIIDVGAGVVVAVPFYIAKGTDLARLMAEADKIADGRPVVAMGHTTLRGSDTTGHDPRIIGSLEAVEASEFLPPSSYDYLALGHIHRSQRVGAMGRIRYSSSPLAVSFDEAYPHSVTWVEIERRGDIPATGKIEIDQPRPLVTLPSPGRWVALDEALECLREFPDDTEAFVRLNVKTDRALPASANDDARRAAVGKRCRVCHINVRRQAEAVSESGASGMSVDELRMVAPADVARLYAQSVGVALDEELFDEILTQLTTVNPDDETA